LLENDSNATLRQKECIHGFLGSIVKETTKGPQSEECPI